MTPPELLDLLRDFYRDKLTHKLRHEAGAQLIPDYDVNNTYQYIIAREDVQLAWLRAAIADLGGEPPTAGTPELPGGRGDARVKAILEADAGEADRFVERWRDRVGGVTNARHLGMLRVILGETLEHKRFFLQGLNGRTDLLGRRADGAGTGGGVMATRWIE